MVDPWTPVMRGSTWNGWVRRQAGFLLDEPYDDPRRLQAMALEDLERTSDAFEMPPSDPDTPTATALPTALRNLRRYRLKSPKSASSELAQGLADIASTGQPGARL